MKCTVCGHTDKGYYPDGYPQEEIDKDKFIELAVVERGPFFFALPHAFDVSAAMSTPDGIPAVKRGSPCQLLACPNCGAVQIDIASLHKT